MSIITFTLERVAADSVLPANPRAYDTVIVAAIGGIADFAAVRVGPVAGLDLSLAQTSFVAVFLGELAGAFSLAESAAPGTVAGTLSGTTAGATLTLIDDAGGRVALSGNDIVRGSTALDYETATIHSFTVRETLSLAEGSPRDTVLSLAVTDIDDTAPVLSGPVAVASGNSTADLAVSTDTAEGTLYWFVSTSALAPSAADLKAGSGAVDAGNLPVSAIGVQVDAASGLAFATPYYVYFLHRDLAGNESAIAAASSFIIPGFNFTDSDGNGFTSALFFTDSDGNLFTPPAVFTDSDGNAFVPA